MVTLWKLNFHSRKLNEINKTKLPKTMDTKAKYERTLPSLTNEQKLGLYSSKKLNPSIRFFSLSLT